MKAREALPGVDWAGTSPVPFASAGTAPILMGSGKALSQSYSAANLFKNVKG